MCSVGVSVLLLHVKSHEKDMPVQKTGFGIDKTDFLIGLFHLYFYFLSFILSSSFCGLKTAQDGW